MDTILLCSAYLPPIEFFTAINNGGDVLIEQYDNYCKQTYRNRCRIATASGVQALTIPIVKSNSPKQLMKDVRISDHGEWRHHEGPPCRLQGEEHLRHHRLHVHDRLG